MARSLFLGGGSLWGVSVAEALLDGFCGISGAEKPHFTHALLSRLIQHGADELILEGGSPIGKIGPSVRKRVRLIDRNSAVRERLNDAFSFPNGYLGEAQNLQGFIGDIASAAALGVPVLQGVRMPRRELARELPLEIWQPCSVFLDGFRSVEADIALPASQTSKHDITVLLELIERSSFEEYVEAHSELQNASGAVDKIIAHVRQKRDRLIAESRGLLSASRTRLLLLERGSTALEGALGRTRGGFAAMLLEIIFEAIERGRNLIVYQDHNGATLGLFMRCLAKAADGGWNRAVGEVPPELAVLADSCRRIAQITDDA